MDKSIKHGVIGIILAFTLGAAYIFERKLNDVYREGLARDRDLSFLKHRNEDFKVKVESLEGELSSLKKAMRELADEIKRMSSTPSAPIKFYPNCMEILKYEPDIKWKDGVYQIYVNYQLKSVYCDMSTDGGGWTVIQRRKDGSTDFFRPWRDYKQGFGDPSKEYWIGNDAIHDLTKTTRQELRVDLQRFDGDKAYALYSRFEVGDEISGYKLSVGGYSGTAGDGLAYHNGMQFSTHDHDNDLFDHGNCAEVFQAGWWYGACYHSNLNGRFAMAVEGLIEWVVWKADESLKGTMMMIRPKGFRFHDALMQVANGDVWTTCGFYKGPGEDFQIIFTICNDVVRGDTLMIAIQSNNSNESIQVCEVEVFEKI